MVKTAGFWQVMNCVAASSAVLVCILVCVAQSLSEVPDHNANLAPTHQRIEDAKKVLAEQASGPFEPSLQSRENADFLLTPALIVQQGLQGDKIPTYPRE